MKKQRENPPAYISAALKLENLIKTYDSFSLGTPIGLFKLEALLDN